MARKRDVFGILPTGFGKSLIFQLLPRLTKDLWKLDHACVLVVTPLVSIMKDQVEEFIRLGLRAFTMRLTGLTTPTVRGLFYICRFLSGSRPFCRFTLVHVGHLVSYL